MAATKTTAKQSISDVLEALTRDQVREVGKNALGMEFKSREVKGNMIVSIKKAVAEDASKEATVLAFAGEY